MAAPVRALAVVPGTPRSAALIQMAAPPASGQLLIESHAVGICGTDREILDGLYGAAPPGETRLVLGHESVGRVVEAPPSSGFFAGDWVVGIVRRPDPVPCSSCARGEWDMCRNGLYTECGIQGRHGFAVERFALEPGFAVKIDPGLGELAVLLEPTSVVAKAWDHIERIGRRAHFAPERVLVTGAGPVGLLAALLAVQRGYEVHVLDRVEGGPKPARVRELGATYHTGSVERACRESDVILECTGAAPVIVAAMSSARPNGIICLTGVSSGGHVARVDIGALNRDLVLENTVIFGSVNANRAHYEQGAAALARADRAWLERLITRRVQLDDWREALEPQPSDVKTVLMVRGDR